jgi:hypothetical protein
MTLIHWASKGRLMDFWEQLFCIENMYNHEHKLIQEQVKGKGHPITGHRGPRG